MAVHFVYRSHYAGPTIKLVKHFPEPTVLDWFRKHWQPLADEDAAYQYAQALFGCYVHTFYQLFIGIAEEGVASPRTIGRLASWLPKHLYINEILPSPHCLQILTDDDELDLAMYFFDDEFVQRHRDQVAYLLHEDWKLQDATAVDGSAKGSKPKEKTTELQPAGEGQGATFAVFLAAYASGNLDDLEGGYRFDGIRLPELLRHLVSAPEAVGWPRELSDLRKNRFGQARPAHGAEPAFLKALDEDAGNVAMWGIFSDWLQERDEPPAGLYLLRRALTQAVPAVSVRRRDPARDLVFVGEHVAQACLHTGDNEFHQWIFFDDLWVRAYPAMADALLRYARRWDVLSR
jgi:hypothetical protein